MLKILMPIMIALIVFFVFKIKRGMSAVNDMYNKENIKDMEEIKVRINEQLKNNRTIE